MLLHFWSNNYLFHWARMNIEKNNDLTRRSIVKVTFMGLFVYNI